MTNDEIIKLLPKLPELKAKHQRKLDLVHRLLDKADKEAVIIETLESVTEVYKGIPLKVTHWNDYSFTISLLCLTRSGYIYQNMHNETTYGITLEGYRVPMPVHPKASRCLQPSGINRGEQWLGADFASKEECIEIVKEWLIS